MNGADGGLAADPATLASVLSQEVIIISPVRANSCERLGFVSDRRRLNVALTRAMRAVVVVGHRETLSTSPLWRSWIEQATHAL